MTYDKGKHAKTAKMILPKRGRKTKMPWMTDSIKKEEQKHQKDIKDWIMLLEQSAEKQRMMVKRKMQ